MGAFYINSVSNFIADKNENIIGTLLSHASRAGFYDHKHAQTWSWQKELDILRACFKSILSNLPTAKSWGVLLEYPIARRDKRIDVIIIAYQVIIVVEFKVGSNCYASSDKDQVLDYCLDLRDFHFESKGKVIVPILLSTKAGAIEVNVKDSDDLVKDPVLANDENLSKIILAIVLKWALSQEQIDIAVWNHSIYSPTPTIIEAARALYTGKSVIEISQSHARKINLTKTSKAVLEAIRLAKEEGQKVICFITGVPGAGKTLAGLNIAHDKSLQSENHSLATFISGNAPLIKVLRKALSNDAYNKAKKIDKAAKHTETERVIAFIENAHSFLTDNFEDKKRLPNNKVVIFDEAQRAWDAKHSEQKFKRPYSESEMIFEVMDRHKDWAVIVALVGGGQEINKGEAGLPEWGKTVASKFSHWKIYISPQLKIGDHSTGNLTLFEDEPQGLQVIEDENLHLDVSIRSYKADKLSEWVGLVLNNAPAEALELYTKHLKSYKIVLSRDLDLAKNWLRSNCKGTRRMGLVATSGARRLLPYGMDVRMPLEESEWFLNGREDVRSSYFLELAATEYRIQGLELDWIGLCWDLDLRRKGSSWDYKAFSGTKWQSIATPEKQRYLINKYRVLLTRGREGMIIFVPSGDHNDKTRDPQQYNSIANYLNGCGVKEI